MRALVRSASIALLAMGMFSSPAQAALTLWDNGGPSLGGGSNMSGFHQAADFTTSIATNLSSITFWTFEAPGSYAGSIDFNIFGNASSTPDESNSFASGNVSPTRTVISNFASYSLVKYDFSVSITNLPAGSYWLALHDGPLTSGSDATEFYWAWSDDTGNSLGSMSDQERSLFPADPTWGTNQVEHAFAIAGVPYIEPSPVNEPGTVMMAFVGLGWLTLRARRRAPR